MIKSTVREVFNRPQPEAVVRAWRVDDFIQIGVIVAAALAILLAIIALLFYRHKLKQTQTLLVASAIFLATDFAAHCNKSMIEAQEMMPGRH